MANLKQVYGVKNRLTDLVKEGFSPPKKKKKKKFKEVINSLKKKGY